MNELNTWSIYRLERTARAFDDAIFRGSDFLSKQTLKELTERKSELIAYYNNNHEAIAKREEEQKDDDLPF